MLLVGVLEYFNPPPPQPISANTETAKRIRETNFIDQPYTQSPPAVTPDFCFYDPRQIKHRQDKSKILSLSI